MSSVIIFSELRSMNDRSTKLAINDAMGKHHPPTHTIPANPRKTSALTLSVWYTKIITWLHVIHTTLSVYSPSNRSIYVRETKYIHWARIDRKMVRVNGGLPGSVGTLTRVIYSLSCAQFRTRSDRLARDRPWFTEIFSPTHWPSRVWGDRIHTSISQTCCREH